MLVPMIKVMMIMMMIWVMVEVGDTMDLITANLTRIKGNVMFAVTWLRLHVFHPTTSKEGLQSMVGMSICLLVRKRN